MKPNIMRYSVTAFCGSLAVASMCNAAVSIDGKWYLAIIGSMVVGMLCAIVVETSDE